MRIYITGIAGFLGSNLADFYLNKGYEVIGCDNLIGGDRENVNDRAEFIKGDCEDLDLMTRTKKKVEYDISLIVAEIREGTTKSLAPSGVDLIK